MEGTIRTVLGVGKREFGEDFRLYVTAYAPFFNAKTDQCSEVTWSVWKGYPKWIAPQGNITKELRRQANAMSDELNSVIETAVANQADFGNVEFVDWAEGKTLDGRRYCELGVKEPAQRAETWFFQDETVTDSVEDDAAYRDLVAKTWDPNVSDFKQFEAKHNGTRPPMPPGVNSAWEMWAAVAKNVNDSDVDLEGLQRRFRVFHPKVVLHSHIKDVILDRLNNATSAPVATTTKPGQTPLTPLPQDECKVQYKFFWDSFNITGIDFDSNKFDGGDGLKKQISGCGALTHWKFTSDINDPAYKWDATGRLPIGVQGCVERAITSAGGPTADQCGGCDGC